MYSSQLGVIEPLGRLSTLCLKSETLSDTLLLLDFMMFALRIPMKQPI